MGRNGDSDILEDIKETAARGIETVCSLGDTIFMQNVKHMIVAVVAQADGGKIHRLTVHDHGTKDGCLFGKDWIDINTFEKFAPYLSKLQPLFTKEAIVHLTHCEMGQNTDLMFMFAATFNRRVYAGTGLDAAAPYNLNTGKYVGVTPGGTIFQEVRRP